MNAAISAICGSSIPCVVTDGVPMRRPLVTNGLRGSSGTVFLFSVMPASSSVIWATLPVSSASNGRRSTTIRWLSVPPDTSRKPSPASASASAEALVTIWWAYSLNDGWAASRNATALPAMTCSSGPPCQPGNTALSIARGVLGLRQDAPAARTAQRLVRRERDDVGDAAPGSGARRRRSARRGGRRRT